MVVFFEKNLLYKMDYLFYSFYMIQTEGGKYRNSFFMGTPEDHALWWMAVVLASIIATCADFVITKDFHERCFFVPLSFAFALVIYYLLSFFYDSDKAIRKIEKKSKWSRIIGYVMSALLVLFVLWLWFRDF